LNVMTTLSDFVRDVRIDFRKNQWFIKQDIQEMIPCVKIIDVKLWGSYGRYRTHVPCEESDVDLLVQFDGDMTEPEVEGNLIGKIIGHGGVYDIIAHKASKKMTDLELKELAVKNDTLKYMFYKPK